MGGKISPRIRLTSAKVVVEVEAELGNVTNISLAAKGALAHGLQNPKLPPGGPKMAEGVWNGVFP